MKTKLIAIVVTALALLSTLTFQLSIIAQGTAITYQGRLNDGGNAANGTYDLRFIVYNADSGGSQVGGTLTNSAVIVNNGLFNAALNFGAGIFNGNAYWLEISVRTNGGGAFVPVNPRQPLTPTPYAITAGNVSGTVPAAQLSGPISSANVSGTYGNAVTLNNAGNSFSGSGAGLTGLNASELASGLVPDARLADNIARTNRVWLLGGNIGTTPGTHFLGTADPQALELRVNGSRALRLEPTTNNSMVNVIGGSSGNYVDPGVVGATIAGGGTLNFGGNQNTNRVAANFGVIGGGWNNLISSGAGWSLIAGGSENLIDTRAGSSAIGGGDRNVIRADANSSTIAGGFRNTIETNSNAATIGGGLVNTIQANAANATIAGGGLNTIQTHADLAFIGGGNLNSIEANADRSVIGGGTRNTNSGATAFIGGGIQNFASGDGAVIGGGSANTIQANVATIAGGTGNLIQGGAPYAVIGGGNGNTIETNSNIATIGGGSLNTIQANADIATIAGGVANLIQAGATYAAIGGGNGNTNGGTHAFIGGGFQNFASGNRAVIGGGYQNVATNSETTIGGGANNFAGGWNAAIGGGALNTASGDYSFVGAGFQNQATTNYATVPGGYGNRANGDYSLAAGRFGRADHRGAFVWADSMAGTFSSTTSNQFSVRANGGVRLVTGGTGMTLDGQPVLSGTITSTQLADGAVGTAQIADGTIRSGDLNLLSFVTTFWKADGNSGTTAGANFIGTTDNQPLEFKVNSQRGLRLEPGASNSVNVIGGWAGNNVAPGVVGATIAGGGAGDYFGPQTNKVTADFGTVGGGNNNNIAAVLATIAGGHFNRIGTNSGNSAIGGGYNNNIAANSGAATIAGGFSIGIGTNSSYCAIGGGLVNEIAANASYATIAGGAFNDIATNSQSATIAGGRINNIGMNSSYGAIGGGQSNNVDASYGTIGGGFQNIASGLCATVPGGQQNTASAFGAFAAGFRASANHVGSFVWADDHDFNFASTAANKVRFRCTSGFDIITAIDGSGNQTAGVFLSPGDTSWNVISDRNAKKNLQPVDAVAVLSKLAAIPVAQWNYKWESDTNTAHLGPMAQDFKAAFFPGRDDKSISTLEFDGVELAAIQGLNEVVKEKDTRISALEKQNVSLENRLAALEKLVSDMTANGTGRSR